MNTIPRRLGKYELQEKLGRGGMGEVWKAFDTQLQRNVAIKLLHADLQSDPNFVSRFQREAQVIASLHHPNIVQIYDFQVSQPPESESTTAYMVMDYVEGQTLANYIRSTSRTGQFPSDTEILHLFTAMGLAIDYAHQKGMIHRDIKPANILLDKRHTIRSPMGEPVLTDFGIAKLLGSSSSTLSGWWFGTPLYTSPEQAIGSPATGRSDLYSLGVILYEICTGVVPFQGENAAVILMQHINAVPTSPAVINPNISPALALVIMSSIAKDPANRFPNAASMVAALAEALNKPIPDGLSQPIYRMDAIHDLSQPRPMSSYQSPNMMPPMSVYPAQVASPFTTLGSQDNRANPGPPSAPIIPSVQYTPAFSSAATPPPQGTHYFMVQEFVGGENLEERLNRLNQPMGEREVLIYAAQVLDILNDLERQKPPVIHGNIRPANIVIGSKDGRAHLVGFGSALNEGVNNPQSKHTPVGSSGYAPLEQLQGHADPRCDLYGLAATMHHLLTNRNPRNHPAFSFPLARMLNPQLSPEAERILIRGLTNDINQRYQSAPEMKRDIDDILLGRYGISGDIRNPGVSGPMVAVGTTPAPPKKGVTRMIDELLHPSEAKKASTDLNPSTGIPRPSSPGGPVGSQSGFSSPMGMYSGPQQAVAQPRKSHRLRNIIIGAVLLLLILGILIPVLTLRSGHSTTVSTSTNGLGIGVTRAADGEYIGLSDGTFAFDTQGRPGGDQMKQAADKLKAGDSGSAQTLWQAAAVADSSNAEPLIYLEDQRVLASGNPYITLVVGTMLTGGDNGVGRGDIQGAYVAQKEYNDGFKLPNGTQVRLLLANTGNSALYATPVAQQIVQAASTDKTMVGVMGWPFSSRALNAIKVLAAAHIPMVSQSATSVLLNGISPYFFRVAPPDTVQAAAGAKYVEQTLHAKTVALFVDPTDAYSKSLADAFSKQFTADGNSIVVTEQYTVGKPATLPARLQDALQHNPNLIYFSGFAQDVNTLVTDLPTSGPFANILVMGGDGLNLQSAYTTTARANLGRIRFTTLAYPDEWGILGLSAQQPSFFREYPAHFDSLTHPHPGQYGYSRPSNEVMVAFDATTALLEGSRIALGGKKSFTPIDLRQALTTIRGANAIQGVSGQIAFGSDGNPIDKAIVVLAVTKDDFFQIKGVVGRFLK